MSFNIDGLISGLDTASIIEGLVGLQQAQVDRITLKKSDIQIKQRAFQGVEARLLSLRSKMSQLNRTGSNAFNGKSVSSSEESIITATGSSKAAEGSYNLRVTSRARAHQIGSTGFTSTSQAISSGTISFQVGDRPPTEITVDSANNSVNGLVQTINSQSSDVSATVIHDQASGTDRILLTSRHSGSANEITVNNQLAAASGDTARPDFSGPAIQDATNATIQLGSGAGAITAEYDSNSVEGLIEGVTLNLNKVDLNTDVLINVSRDTTQASESIKEFVDEYNSLINYINEQTKYNSETQAASPLLGNRSVASLKNELGAMMTEVVPGLESDLNRFSQIGIQIDGTGKLILDSGKLEKALSGNIEGVNPDDISQLFGLAGQSNNSGVEFLLGSSRTLASSTPYEIDITQAAERATATATSDLAASIVLDNSNNQFEISIDGLTSESLTLTEGTYTRAQLAEHLQSVINASSELGNREVAVSLEGNKINITSLSYGSKSEISDISGSALATIGFDGSENNVGKDVVGFFIVDGVTEVATGSGRILIGNADNENTADLQVRVTLDPSQVHAGIESTLNVTRGVTSRLDQFLGNFLDTETGSLSIIQKSFDTRIESFDNSIEQVNEISASKRDYLVRQFAALERALSEMQTTSSIVASQLAGI